MKWTIAVALVLGAIGSITLSRPAEALPTQMIEWTYYSNASMTQEVGWKVLPSCYGSAPPLVGQQTQFYSRITTRCNDGVVRGLGCYQHGNKINCPATICQQVPEFC